MEQTYGLIPQNAKIIDEMHMYLFYILNINIL